MAAPTKYYVDPAIAADSGSGTIGAPYGDLQYALNTITRNSTDGDQINIKAGTDEILTAKLSFATFGAPSFGAPCIFRGYTSAANDGGIGGVSGNAGNFTLTDQAGVYWVDMHGHNTGSAIVVTMGRGNCYVRSEFNNSSTHALSGSTTEGTQVWGCHIHDIGGAAINSSISGLRAFYNYIKNDGTHTMTTAIVSIGLSTIERNIISIDSTTSGIDLGTTFDSVIVGNSIFSNAGTGKGIITERPYNVNIVNNIIEGFSGSGGVGFSITDVLGEFSGVAAGNAAYNNATNYSAGFTQSYPIFNNDNETLSATGFAKSGSNTYANRYTYFNPVNTGNIYGGAFTG